MPVAAPAPAAPDPDDRDYLTEHDLETLGLDPDAVPVLAPHATEYRALDGARCWARADIAHLLEGN